MLHATGFLSLVLAYLSQSLPRAHAIGHCREVTYLFGSNPQIPGDLGNVPIGDHGDFLAFNGSDLSETADALEFHLTAPPGGPGKRVGRTNEFAGFKAEINSTFSLLYGVVSVTVSANTVKGTITNLALIGNDMGPVTPETGNHVPFTEIDVEILGSMTDAWDANIFIQRAEDDKWVSDETEGKNGIRLPAGSIADFHTWTVNWSPENITWSVDGEHARALFRSEPGLNNHWPDKASAIGFTQWDGSLLQGLSEWAGGPIEWNDLLAQGINHTTSALKRIDVRCPYVEVESAD